jgi:AraC family transcriptional regulator, transcriptional activator of pobA
MDSADGDWHFADMSTFPSDDPATIPAYSLYGESRAFPDVLHVERLSDRAAGLSWRIAPHRHLHLHQVFLIQSGEAKVKLDGQLVAITPPAILNVPPGVVHDFQMEAQTQGWVLTVPVQTLPGLLGPALSQETSLGWPAVLPANDVYIRLFTQIASEHCQTRPAREIMLGALATELVCHVLRGMGQIRADKAGTDPRFAQFQVLLTQHLRDRWTLSDFAREIGLSPRHLSRICQKATGQPASGVIEAAAMREACRLLVYTRMPVAQIGYGLGFDDPSYFSRAFRRVMGLSPQAYRAGFEGEAAH